MQKTENESNSSPRPVSARSLLVEMSLLAVCTNCLGKCCVGRTMVTQEERQRIMALTGRDHFVHWADDLYYLEKGACGYLDHGRCSVQAAKPFVCLIYPFVPRVVDGELWLFCVGECDAASKLPDGFTEKALRLARDFFKDRQVEKYAEYWNQNKIGDFDDSKLAFKVKVFETSLEGIKS